MRLAPYFVVGLIIFSGLSYAEESLHILPGHQKILDISGVARASIGDPKIADVRVLAGQEQVVITAKKNGSTDLVVWSRNGTQRNFTIDISPAEINLKPQLELLLKDIEGIELRPIGKRWVIDGTIYRGSDLSRIRKIVSLYPSVRNLATVQPDVLLFLAQEIQTNLREAGFEDAETKIAGDTLYIEGNTKNKIEKTRAEEIAKELYPKVINNMVLGFLNEPMVFVDMKFMEIRRNALSQIGIRWPSQVDATTALSLSNASTSTSTSIGGLTVSLQALVSTGAAKVLSNPKILCRNNTPASFLAGGEFPIRLVGERYASVSFKPYGVNIQITARLDSRKQVSLEIDTSVSDLDASTAVEGIPGLVEHKIKTSAGLHLGESIVLAGLFENRSRKNVDKIPFLGHIPILGELFKSRAFQSNESEFLIFLTPLSAEPSESPSSTTIETMRRQMEKMAKDFRVHTLD